MARHLPLLLLLPLVLSACDSVDDYFSVMAAQAMFLGIDEPPAGVDIDLGAAATATAFVAEARSLDSFSANLVNGAQVSIDGVLMESAGSGTYEVDSSVNDALDYVAGDVYTLTVVEGGARTVWIEAPPAPVLNGAPDPQALHPAGTGFTVDLSGQGFQNYIILVGTSDIDGNVALTYDSRPQTADEYIDWIGARDEVGQVPIPGEAFPNPATPYVLGVAGIVRAPDSSFDELNPLVSNFASGTVATSLVTTSP
jgi:hypothetical protein